MTNMTRIEKIVDAMSPLHLKELHDLLSRKMRKLELEEVMKLPVASVYYRLESKVHEIRRYRETHKCTLLSAKFAVELAESIFFELGWEMSPDDNS